MGVGPAMASVMLTAADPTQCGFMADECLMAIPEIDSIDYTTKELLNFVEQLRTAAERLNGSGGSNWNAHKVEQTVWAHVVLSDLKKEALEGMPSSSAKPTTNGTVSHQPEKNGDGESSTDSADVAANKENLTSTNGATPLDEDSNTCDSILSTNTTEGTPVTPLLLLAVVKPLRMQRKTASTQRLHNSKSLKTQMTPSLRRAAVKERWSHRMATVISAAAKIR